MIGCDEMQLSSLEPEYLLSKIVGKIGIIVINNRMRCAMEFEILSMNNMMTNLFPDLGKPIMKFIEIFVQIVGGRGSSWSMPGVLTVLPVLH
jgi:hypothetical protein